MGSNTREIAQVNSIWLLNLEKAVGMDVELGLQKFVLQHAGLLWFFNKYVYRCIADTQDLCHGAHPRFHPVFWLRL